MPRRREPWNGETRQASAIWSPMPRPTARGVEPVSSAIWAVDLGPGERDHLRVLGGGERAAHLFEHGDPVDPIGVGARGGSAASAPSRAQHGGDLGRDGSTAPPASSDRMFECITRHRQFRTVR